jgi:hypothetical protein
MVEKAPQVHELSTSETRNVAVDMRGKLDGTEVCTGAPTITEVTTTDLTLTNKAVSTAELAINGDAVPIGQALQFTVASAATGTHYVDLVCGTNASQTVAGRVTISVC